MNALHKAQQLTLIMKAMDHEMQQTSEDHSTFKALVQAYLIAQKEGCDLERGEQTLLPRVGRGVHSSQRNLQAMKSTTAKAILL